METLRPTVKRDLSLFSVQAWQQGYTKYLEESLGFWYDVYFFYDGQKVNFYHKLSDFEYFKKELTGQLIKDQELFLKLNKEFKNNVSELKILIPNLSFEDLGRVYELAGKIMALYIFVVGDSFVEKQPIAWESRNLSEGVLYDLDGKVEEVLARKLEDTGIDKGLAHFVSMMDIQKISRGENLKQEELIERRHGYILFNEELIVGKNFEEYCEEKKLLNPEINSDHKVSKLIFEKTIARELNLVSAQLWHDVLVNEMKKNLGWSYTEVVFEGKCGNVTIYRAPIEHVNGMLDFMLSSIDSNSEWLPKQIEYLEMQTKVVRKLMNEMEGVDFSDLDRKALALWLRDFFEQSRKLVSGLVVVLWLPIHMEHHFLRDKYKKEIDLAVNCRENVTADITTDIDNFLSRIVNFISSISGLNEKLSPFMTYNDVFDFLESGKEISKEDLLKRKEYYIVTNDGLLYESIEQYLKRHNFSLKQDVLEKLSEVSGSVAYRGVYKGKVVLVNGKSGLNKIEEGDVLVTTMTTPNFVPFLNKVGAVVTDEGGITCHAAIIARELKKPCIIGTKIATQVLKDGDVVEVDADRGVVRKIN